MYEIEEFYAIDGLDLKDVLKSCMWGYYTKNKNIKNDKKDLKKEEKHHIMDTTNKLEILSKKGEQNVQTVL